MSSEFIYGSFILAIINFVVRLIGFSYKIILSKLIGPKGIGLFQMVFPILMVFVTITTAGIPIAVSKLIAKEKSLNNYYRIKKVFKISVTLTITIAIFLAGIVIIFSNFISNNIFKTNEIYNSVILLAPAIILISISSVIRGYFYGLKKVTISGIAQVIEQIARIVFVIGIIYYFYPITPSKGAFIAVCGISVGEAFGLIWLIFNYKIQRYKNTFKNAKNITSLKILYKISYIALPITISRIINVLLQFANAVLIPQRLMIAGYSHPEAVSTFGRVVGMSLPIIFLPFIVTSALVINIIPNLSEQVALKNFSKIKNNISLCIWITLLVSIPLTFLFIFFGKSIAMFFYKDRLVGKYIEILGYSTIFISTYHTLSGILHGLGKQIIATINYLIGMSFQLLATYFLVANPSFAINGFFIGFIVSTAIICILNFISLNKVVKVKINVTNSVLKPAISSILMVLAIFITSNFLSIKEINTYFSFVICMSIGSLVYVLTLFATKGISISLIKKIWK
ncbi:stage V sporulation protein B [Thermohalobacter berrensis]|uniref:stage V sporulation protein B n=1 Tax=Thermohalobacter berrensis TaxID=99594 RepID=UPI001FAA9518|nr:stage V sporulation protein B [Thermohalobacter berrensis]